jgi:putative spermidine/putrescine transport system substrate-binding protein
MKRFSVPAILVALGMVAAACGTTVPSGALTTLPAAEGDLNLVIWVGYAESGATYPEFDWVTQFTQETGCAVHTTDGVDSPNMVSLMATGQYDGVSASGDATRRMIAAGTVAPVNTALIPNYEGVFPKLKNTSYNSLDGVPYGVPQGFGANVLLYNTDTFPEAPTSWDPVWEADSPAAGKISVYNSSIYIADAAMRLMNKNPELGITNPYQLNDAQFEAAVNLLKEQNKIIGEYWNYSTDQITSFGSGTMLAGQSWQYQYNTILLENPDAPVGVTVPDEGATGWSDTWMIAKNAAHPGCMYRWMNWALKAETNAMSTIYFGEAPASQAACDAAETILDGAYKGHCELFHATDEPYLAKIKFWETPQASCNDADDATTCKDIQAWIDAWAEITAS